MFKFEITAQDKDSGARLGRITTSHGTVETPAFMPVGTRATVKAMAPWELEELGFELLLANTYHLYLRPGVELIEQAGGLHNFMGWKGSLLTDSGGYQVFSLSKTLKLSEEGVSFRSVYDGSEHFLSPEVAVAAQESMGVDIAMVLDECVAYPTEKPYVEQSVQLSADWARRCKESQTREETVLFGIVQGGMFPDLRQRSAELTREIDFPGYGIGGFSVGEPQETMLELMTDLAPKLPGDAPRYLMGVGDPVGLIESIALGVDLFDCVLPTRLARNGTAWTSRGKLNIKNARHGTDLGPLDDACNCPACRTFSRAYLRHLYINREILALRLLTHHNLAFIATFMRNCRDAILAGRINELKKASRIWQQEAG